MIKNFSIYALIGVLNTTIHWAVFYVFYSLNIEQSYCNLLAFMCSASFSYLANSKYNFRIKIRKNKYIYFIISMGILTYLIGLNSDFFELSPLLTLVTSSILSLFLGFIVSKFFIFR
ncbi:GtrA family protein [Marinomonas gallaica]|uniref:GtrA family protein n=1 Tax=Marinomonas gallaica TaxID=1806667 RepID=UPI003A92A539